MSLTVAEVTAEQVPLVAAAVAGLPLFDRYGLDGAALKARLARAVAEGDGLLAARAAGGPCLGLAWYLPRGTLATGAYLRLLAVAQDHGGTGVGTALLRAFEGACRGPRGGFFVLSESGNARALTFYRRLGYVRVGELPGFVRPDRVETLLWKAP